jgi:hypothetical protein
MYASDQSLAKQALARQDLKLIGRKMRQLRKFIARCDLSHAALQEAAAQLDDLRFERDTVEMAMETHRRLAEDAAPRSTDGCECGEYGGSPKTCAIHGYGGTASQSADRGTL